MIQRIQSLFWLISIALIAIFVLTSGSSIDLVLYVYLLAGTAIILNLLSIFLFKKRKMQLLFSRQAILCILIVITLKARKLTGGLSFEAYLPILILIGSLIFNILANYFTRKDIKLVEESSRLR